MKELAKLRATMPLDDATIAELDPATRTVIGRQWEDRATAEVRTAAAFAKVSFELLDVGASPEVLQIAARAVADELEHGELCRLAASAYYGRDTRWPAPGVAALPRHADAPRRLRPTLRLVEMCCISETIAAAWLEACLAEARSPLARTVTKRLLADDIRHARLGWMHLASMRSDPLLERTIADQLVPLLDSVLRPWLRSASEGFAPGVPAHAVPTPATTREVVLATVTDAVLPGFDDVGIDTRAARSWLAGYNAA